ncbi:hypothetical protein [Thiohalorhabdus sp.]|uniref:hypothetical protein n=1 Tax=Thiohalorhabdus sp. TaxID=3094134 RepID=UPI002FC32131
MHLPVVHAMIQDDDVCFAVISVKDGTIVDPDSAEKLVETLQTAYQCPVVLMGEASHKLLGRQDLIDFLDQYTPTDLPWTESAVDIPDPSDRPS